MTTGSEDGFRLVRPKVLERIALPSTATGGTLSIMEIVVESGGLVAPEHVHAHEDETVYVVDGTVSARLGGEEVQAGPGSVVFGPRRVSHTFWNAGPGRAHMVMVISPGHLDDYFQGIPAIMANGGPSTPARLARHAAGFGVSLHTDSIAELADRYGVSLL